MINFIKKLLEGSNSEPRVKVRHVISFGMLTAAVLAPTFYIYGLFTRHLTIVRSSEQIVLFIEATLRNSISPSQRQSLIESLQTIDHDRHQRQYGHLESILVFNRDGRVVYSSNPAWLELKILDPHFKRLASKDAAINSLVNCYKFPYEECRAAQHSLNLYASGMPLSVIRSIAFEPSDLGLPRQRYWVVVSYDQGSDFYLQRQQITLLLTFLIATSSALSLVFLLSLYFLVLPRFFEASGTDGLTGMTNRKKFIDLASKRLLESQQVSAESAFAILDIDHFKKINDNYGHECGDLVLVSFAKLLDTVTRPSDLICRFGGEEFAILLPISQDDAGKALERLRMQVEMMPIQFKNQSLSITISVGAVSTRDAGYNIDFLYSRADTALYKAKDRGRNRLEWAESALQDQVNLLTR